MTSGDAIQQALRLKKPCVVWGDGQGEWGVWPQLGFDFMFLFPKVIVAHNSIIPLNLLEEAK